MANQPCEDEKLSPFHDAYSAPTPTLYMKVGDKHYKPTRPLLPDYTHTLLDCACLFGNSTLNALYGWDFVRSCEFWSENKPLSNEARQQNLLEKRIKIIGLDMMPLALEYGRKMNIYDDTVVQNFADPMNERTAAALREADCWVMQQCMSHMPTEHLRVWIAEFLKDRSRPKRFIYDYNPYFDERPDVSPSFLFPNVSGMEIVQQMFYKYRNKTDEEYENNQENGRDMCVHHFVVEFAALN